jgi:hypothetical protein
MSEIQEQAEAALKRIQEFDVRKLPRRESLGSLSFDKAVEPASRLIFLYGLIPLSTLQEFPDGQLVQIRDMATSAYACIDQILQFDLSQSNPQPVHAGLIQALKAQYDTSFTGLYPLIAYAGARAVDFGRLETQGREAVSLIRDQAGAIVSDMTKVSDEAREILTEVRKVAGEQGVSQQAIYFKMAADGYDQSSDNWRNATIGVASVLGLYSIFTLFSNEVPFLHPTTSAESLQIIVSKALIFGVLAYMLALCARNFLANTHNTVVNRHRQNALVTFEVLAKAAAPEQRDIVLAHAAACIFTPQETGFSKSNVGPPQTLVELLPRLAQAAGGHGAG